MRFLYLISLVFLVLLSSCVIQGTQTTQSLEQWFFTLYKPGKQAVTMGPYIDQIQCENAAYDLRSVGVTKDGEGKERVFSYTPTCMVRVFAIK